MATIETNLQAVWQRIARACEQAGRPRDSVRLVAVSKTFPADAISAAAAAGMRDFGENYVQEAIGKIAALSPLGLTWHFIGPIQSNKTRQLAEHFDWIHSLDHEKIALRLAEQRPPSRAPLQVCLQVNISGEASKSGVAPGEVAALAGCVAALPRLRLRGLMAVPEPTADPALARHRFAQLRSLKEQLNRGGLQLDTLSMGMSADLEAAVAEGATMVRVGTAIFGERHTK
ncbi:MAG: YggS family pyridoxal phosphate-dependent enzyme [Betaproteobacteria bacterium]|nr:YggS family pyridoxal phosphate-dependent enzyme [Betaproteobacteria bacterium]